MSQSTAELCRSALRYIEENEREHNKNYEGVNDFCENRIFSIQGRPPNQLEEMELLDAVSTYFTLQREDLTKACVFHQIFTLSSDQRRHDFLIKLTSLALSISTVPILDLVSVWIKCLKSETNGPLRKFTQSLLSDLVSIEPSASLDVLTTLPRLSMTFAESFLLGITDFYNFVDIPWHDPPLSSCPPPRVLLIRVYSWLRQYRDAFLGQSWANTHAKEVILDAYKNNIDNFYLASHGTEEIGRSVLCGLLRWSITHPLSKSTSDHCTEPLNSSNGHKGSAESMPTSDIMAAIHFELLEHIENRPNPVPLPFFELERICSLLTRASIPETPESPTQCAPSSPENADTIAPKVEEPPSEKYSLEPEELALNRLAQVVQLAKQKKIIKTGNSQLEKILLPFKHNSLISIVLQSFETSK